MMYYQVLPQHDNKFPNRFNRKIKNPFAYFLVKNELITPKEWNKRFPGVDPKRYTIEKEISKKQIYFFFGARFAD